MSTTTKTELQEQINLLTWYHAELAWNYRQLVQQIQAMIRQFAGSTNGANPAEMQALRQRAARIARIRNTQQPQTTPTK